MVEQHFFAVLYATHSHSRNQKYTLWKLNANCYLFGLLSKTNLFPRVIFLFSYYERGESKGHRVPSEVKQVDVFSLKLDLT